MKKIEAVIRPAKLHELKEELCEIDVHGITVLEAGGFGRQRGHEEMFRGNVYDVDIIPKIMVVIITREELAESIIEKIRNVCYTGKVGDGKIFLSTIDEVIRIRTGERGTVAL